MSLLSLTYCIAVLVRKEESSGIRGLLTTSWLVESCHVTSMPRPMSSNHRSGHAHCSSHTYYLGHAHIRVRVRVRVSCHVT